MKLLLAIGVLVLVALCVLEAIYFRRALFIMVLPALVSALSAAALARSDPRLLWPIIGISVPFWKCPNLCAKIPVFPYFFGRLCHTDFPLLLPVQAALHHHGAELGF